eukprot:CAMPEP_0180391998 /NCGR_PEP_ID=MMETSP0989-20121125/32910_1 /TAXON_ID=697907 /ORGANISM="non described non described, Strain CCMP2293" /LENGTH=39 /DNA_ID= /DNA_START= /DNA_END= /DNA_ORIENTATION=
MSGGGDVLAARLEKLSAAVPHPSDLNARSELNNSVVERR